MEISELQESDASEIQEIAQKSLRDSYGQTLENEIIDAVVENWYSEDEISALLSTETNEFITASNDHIVGFAQGEVLQGDPVIGKIHWVHVIPDARGEGTGSQLLGELVDRMEKQGASVIRGQVLEINDEGVDFFEEHDFEHSGTQTTEIGDTEYEEQIYEKRSEDVDEEIIEQIQGPDGQDLYVDYTAGETGLLAPLYPTYSDPTKTEQYKWLCRNCDSTETAMNASGRIECGNCDNARKATRWDDAYL